MSALPETSGPVPAPPVAPAGNLALELRNVAKSYGPVQAVNGVSLTLAKGEFLTLLGPSGCGKTTLMAMIAGFFPPTAGEIYIDGRDVTSLMPHRRDTGIVFQNYALFPHMTVARNVAFGLEERRVARPEIQRRVTDALEMVKLGGMADRKPSQLSGGQQQRVALARALVIQPRVLLLDEPLSALDKNLRTQMQIEIKQIQRNANVATVFVTHDQNEALSLSDRIAVMNHGSVEQVGTPRDIYCNPKSKFVASFVGEINRLPVRVALSAPARLELVLPGGERLVARGPRAGDVQTGAAMDLFVRPEDIDVVDAAAEGGNLLSAKVLARSYQGSFTLIVAQTPHHEQLLVHVPAGHGGEAYASGDAIKLHLNLDRASLLAS